VLKEIERRFRMNERMLRYMTVISEGPLAPPRAEGGSDGSGIEERSPSLSAPEVPVAFETPAAIEVPVVSETPVAVEAPVTPLPAADDTSAEPADGASF
jgi:hypothetical protein